MPAPSRLTFAVLAAAAALLAAPLAHAQDEASFKLVARDGRFTPPDLEVPANQRLRIEISNEGKTPIEFESKSLRQEKVIAPGAKATVVISPLKPGSYTFFDEFHPDTSKGKLIAK